MESVKSALGLNSDESRPERPEKPESPSTEKKDEGERNWFGDKFSSTLGGGKEGEAKADANDEEGEGSWLGNKINTALGGGKESESKEDKLDKAIDFIQEHGLRAGDQSSESALEQAKDEQISDSIRRAYKSATGHEFPVSDKEH